MTLGCPTIEHLQAFLSGRLTVDDIDSVALHLDTCARCEATLNDLSPDDELIAALAMPMDVDSFVDEQECRRALKQIADESLANATLLFPNSSVEEDAERNDAPAPLVTRESPAAVRFGQYILLRQIGRGGMGAVYQALHTRLERFVAIKMLVSDRMQDAEAVARFQREMRAVGRLEHPHIVRAMDAGEQDGVHYLVMEYVNGPDVAALVSEHGQLPVADACEIARQVALGLDYAFKRGLVHRDIKPSNVMISVGEASATHELPPTDEPAIVRVLDFGLALLEDNPGIAVAGFDVPPNDGDLTSVGQLMGTLDYIAPEQVGSSHDVDVRADLYSLGATLFKMLTGSAPHAVMKGADISARIDAILKEDVPSVETLRSSLPPSLTGIVAKMLSRDPQARFQTPLEVATALAEFTPGADLKALALASWQQAPVASTLRSAPSVLAKMQEAREATLPFLPGSELDAIEPTTDRQRTAETGANIQRTMPAQPLSATTIQLVKPVDVPQERSRSRVFKWLALPVVIGLACAAFLATRPQTPSTPEASDDSQLQTLPLANQETAQANADAEPVMSEKIQPLEAQPRWPFDPDDGVTYVWSIPENLGAPVNSDAVDLLWGISDDERTIYIRRSQQLIALQRPTPNEPFGMLVSDDHLVMGENWGGVTAGGLLAYSCTKGSLKQNELWLARRTSIHEPFGPRTLGNTDDAEGSRNAPAISPDGLTLLIGKHAAGRASSDLCLFTRSNLDEPFSKGQLLPSPVSTPDWDMAYLVSNDRRFVIASTQRRENQNTVRRVRYFWRASSNDEFQTAMPLRIPLGNAEDSDANGAYRLADGGRAIYFTGSDSMGGHGASDVWVSRREPLTEPVYLDDLPEVEYFAHLDDTGPLPGGKKFGTHGVRHDAEPFRLQGQRPQHSVMLHPLINETAYVSYDLDRQYAVFEGRVGLGDTGREMDVFAPITFRIVGDGQELWTSRPLTIAGASQEFGVVVENVKKLRLEVLCPGSNDFAHACWIEPRLRRRPNAPPLRAQTAPPELKASEWTDVTTAIRPALHSNGGLWEVRDHALLLTGDTPLNNPRISLPVEIAESYELKLKATRTSGNGPIAIHLPVGQRHCVASFNTEWPGRAERVVGLQFLKQLRAFTDGNPTRSIIQWETNRTYELHFIIELLKPDEARIRAARDEQVLIDWTGPISDLSADPRWHRPSPGLGSNIEMQARFESIQLKLR